MSDEQIVISLNDYPEEVCAPGTTFEQAILRCADLKDAYLNSNPHMIQRMVYFHCRKVRTWSPE